MFFFYIINIYIYVFLTLISQRGKKIINVKGKINEKKIKIPLNSLLLFFLLYFFFLFILLHFQKKKQ